MTTISAFFHLQMKLDKIVPNRLCHQQTAQTAGSRTVRIAGGICIIFLFRQGD